MSKITINTDDIIKIIESSYVGKEFPNATQVNLGVSIVAIELKKYLREKGAYISYD